MLAFSIVIYTLSSDYREDEFYGRLRDKALTTARLLYEANQRLTPQTMQLVEEEGKSALFDEHVTVYESTGKLIYNNSNNIEAFSQAFYQRLLNEKDKEIRFQRDDREFLYILHNEPKASLVVVVSAIDTYGFSKIRFLTGILSLGWLGAVVVAIAAGWVFSGNALAPIADVISQVDRIDPVNLQGKVVAGQERDEIAQLAKTFNRMLVRIRRSFEAQRGFVTNASHELRTPLTVMKGQIQVALLQNRNEDEYRSLLQSLGDDVTNMTGLANDLLELAQASADVSSLQFEPARVDEILLQAEADLRKKHPNYRVAVNYAGAPEEEEAYNLLVNERLLKNAFYNLMENACKFSSDNAVRVTMHISELEIQLDFSDNGPGIRPEDIPHIFEPFFRAEDSRKLPGHGIGLPLVKRILDLHQGVVTVTSQVNQGTTFSVTMPTQQKRNAFVPELEA